MVNVQKQRRKEQQMLAAAQAGVMDYGFIRTILLLATA